MDHHALGKVDRSVPDTHHPFTRRETASTLETESGYQLESSDVTQLRYSIQNGIWDDAAALLIRLGVTMENELRVRWS